MNVTSHNKILQIVKQTVRDTTIKISLQFVNVSVNEEIV